MRAAIGSGTFPGILKWSQCALFGAGVLLLGCCAFALADAWVFQRRASTDLDRQLRARNAAGERAKQPGSPTPPMRAPDAATDGLIGSIEIPRVLLSGIVVEGVDKTALRRAVGHIPGTALPGEAGNVGLAGHRDTFFRPLKDLKIKDKVQVTTLNRNITYEVESLRVVDPNNVGVLASSGENVLTLVTCYPFYYVGPAPKRFVVRARQVSALTAAGLAVK